MEYCLLEVGIRPLLDQEPTSDEIIPIKPFEPSAELPPTRFTFERQSYTSLLESTADIKSLIRDVSRVPEYRMCERTNFWDSSSIVLGVFLRIPQHGEDFDYNCAGQRTRLMQLLFTESERHCFIEEELEKKSDVQQLEDDSAYHNVTKFYEQLRLRHRDRQTSTENGAPPEPIEHIALRPQLRPYQQQAIRWLIERETVPSSLPAQYVRLRSAAVPEVDFYADLYTLSVMDTEPQPIPIPAGGILADEMGLGKTVEILALLLFNRRAAGQLEKHETKFTARNKRWSQTKQSGKEKKAELKCICINKKRTETIKCQKCGQLQHRKCVLKHQLDKQPNRSPDHYVCPECWRSEPLVESGATIIVTPAAIKHQWASEIQKHISCPYFRLFLYNGVCESDGSWISPTDLASYDVVLTDYNVLKPEIYFTSENARHSRHEKRYLRPTSPLTMIRWWRVCLDEAQMVECVNNNATKMVKALPAVHRWTVTGTPIEKSIDNLYGLVHYLDYAPYNNFFIWRAFVERYRQGNAEPLLTVMARIMWRTCKISVLDQLGIPPQTERVHYITMSDVQRHFYRSEHTQCATAFHEKARRIGRTLSMAKMNIQTLNQLMEPLRKLRHDCTIPTILHVANTFQTKKLLTQAELHEHLVTSNVNDCKAQLRTVVSSLNGIAGVQLLQGDFNHALRLYEASIRMADDYKTGPITVDSLLQIHALHNLLELVRVHTNELDADHTILRDPTRIQEYEERSVKLEWRYIEQYVNKVRAVEADLFPAIERLENTIAQTESKQLRLDGTWWRNLFYGLLSDTARGIEFFNRLLGELPKEAQPPVSSWAGLDLWFTTWWDKIGERRDALKTGFQKLEFFVNNLQSRHLCSSAVRARIDHLVSSAFACHLDPALALEEESDRRGPAPICLLCTVKDKLNHLEAVLFHSKKTQAATGGLWQISYSEAILKQLLSFAKRSQDEVTPSILADGDHSLAYLEQVKQEFKEYSRYWVELNYTVAAYDELNMCKSRLQLINEEHQWNLERSKKKRTPMQLLPCELTVQMQELQQTKAEAERAFVRLQGTLKYLEHLGQKSDIDPCPICQTLPDSKYVVLQCGHHCCSICAINLFKMASERQHMISCVICRHQQHVRDIQYVTMHAAAIGLKGNYSAKIEMIIEIVLDLKNQEPDVKIVIFSHWEPILVKLEEALTHNSISSRQKSYKSNNGVTQFKDPKLGITCLLLPLRYGSKGLNLTEATHVFLVEPILNPGEELQAIGRIHRIGQTRPTFVHRFIVRDTIEETIYDTIQKDQSGRWMSKDVTVEQLEELFHLKDEEYVL